MRAAHYTPQVGWKSDSYTRAGTAADLIKKAMVAVQDVLDAEKPGVLMIMQVHDELVFELPEEDSVWLRTEVPRLMAGVAELKVPLLAEVGMGPNWEKAHWGAAEQRPGLPRPLPASLLPTHDRENHALVKM